MAINAFLFDIGNVLTHFDFNSASEAFAEQSDTDKDPIKLIGDIRESLEEGMISGPEFIEESIDRMGFQGTDDDFIEIYQDIFTPNLPVWSIVNSLADRMPIYLFSNTSEIHREGLFRDFDVFSKFDDGIYSYEAKLLKPGEDIFQMAIEEFELDPEETGYLDDLAENIATGKRVGLQCHLYDTRNHPACVSWIRDELGLETE